jgi:6-phosphogluconolactonase (cycloisomerase 2 family)
LGGDLTLTATTYSRVLHITGDWSNSGTSGNLVIDGRGYTLNIQDRAQIFVDTNVTLTLRNMTIRTGPKSLNVPAIRLASPGSKLALDNVMLDLGTDFQFKQGQLFIHDEVAVTGTSAFIYQSPMPSYITSGATWGFESGTTFSVAPATFTDCPYTVNNTYTTNNFIVFANQSSTLYLDSCTFSTTFTGVRLRTGTVLFDNRIPVNTQAGVDLASTPTTPIGFLGSVALGSGTDTCFRVAWSPDAKFFAVADYTAGKLAVYKFNPPVTALPPPIPPNTFVLVGSVVTSLTQPFHIAWSPDRRFIAVTSDTSPGALQIFRFTGNGTPTLVGSSVVTGNATKMVAWSPDGKFLAVVNFGGTTLQVYRFDGFSTPVPVGGTVTTDLQPDGVAWSPDGRFIAVVNYGGNSLLLFRVKFNAAPVPINGTNAASEITTGVINPIEVAWSPDGRYLAVTNRAASSGTASLQIFRFYGGGAIVLVGSYPTGASSQPFGLAWSPDGRFLVVSNNTATPPTVMVLRFTGTGNPSLIGSSIAMSTAPAFVSWSSDGLFVAVAAPGGIARVYRCNYYFTGQSTQNFTNGLVFGNSANGSAYDANVKMLRTARVEVTGKMMDDSI